MCFILPFILKERNSLHEFSVESSKGDLLSSSADDFGGLNDGFGYDLGTRGILKDISRDLSSEAGDLCAVCCISLLPRCRSQGLHSRLGRLMVGREVPCKGGSLSREITL